MAEARRTRTQTPLQQHHAAWAAGYGAVRHTSETQRRIAALAKRLHDAGELADPTELYRVLHAADRVASAGMWLVVHQTYANQVYLDGRSLRRDDFKPHPEGHTGGALNMAPAYAGYLAANVVTKLTRGWVMGQGHTVAAIDALNLLVANMTPAHAARYSVTDDGLTRYVRDFYSYQLNAEGRQDSPLGSHVNAHTAGGIAEGGYLGFVDLEYVHMPLPGERLVVFLSDGAFEEQRGADWAARWWRADDSGLVAPIMINNGRRIDQRTTMKQEGGVVWFKRHLQLNGFEPLVFDGRDPAAFLWAILEMEHRLTEEGRLVQQGHRHYPVRLPYGIAVAPKGAGFFGAGTNLAHNLPLGANPYSDSMAAERFNRSARRLWVPAPDLAAASAVLQEHAGREKERDNPLANRQVAPALVPEPAFRMQGTAASPMDAVDEGFLAVVQANPHLRPRVGNPDEMKSNRLAKTLEALKFRVTAPERGIPEDVHGAVVTALNEEAVAAAALGNKGGINLICTYEAFGVKMLGLVRQEVIFAKHLAENGRPPGWLSVPLVLTSHTWENGKNEQSHQDPTMAEALLGEASDVSRVLFPADYNTAAAVMAHVYRTHGQIWTVVSAKSAALPVALNRDRAEQAMYDGGVALGAQPEGVKPQVLLVAVGAYQLQQAQMAARRLTDRGVPAQVTYLLEPGRFRAPRSEGEAAHLAPRPVMDQLFPASAESVVLLTHTRPEPIAGLLAPRTAARRVAALGYLNQGGTLDADGMLWVNRSSWLHAVQAAGNLLGLPADTLLAASERAALEGRRTPAGVAF